MENKPVAEQDIGRQLLQETAAYAESSVCRRKMLLHYFGEEYDVENCHNCDNCLHPSVKFEAKDALVVVLEAVAAVKENFRQEYIIDFVKAVPPTTSFPTSTTTWKSLAPVRIWMPRYGIR